MSQFMALDLGAESGRALVGQLSGTRLTLAPVHRFANTPVRVGDSLRWNVDDLWAQVRHALATVDTPIASVGIDTWGCDYGLLDERGLLVEPPYHYRDHRTNGVMARVAAQLGHARIYNTTGVQFLPFNSLFQLAAAAESAPATLDRAASLVTMPDLFNYWLTGRITCEYTNATTTQCVDARTRGWATSLLDELGLPARIFGPLIEPGSIVGTLQASAGGPVGVPVVAPSCHDTGSAVASVAASRDTAFLSSGTWSLLGTEVPQPVITTRGSALNFTNEGGVCGTTRLLKNIGGLWLLQACRRDWLTEGTDLPYDALVSAAAVAPSFGPVVDPDDSSFLNPPHMPAAIAAYCRRTGQTSPDSHAVFARTIFESLALKYRLVLEWLEEVAGLSIRTIRVIGGGAQNSLLNQLTADVTGREVLAGPVEATALGNIAMQMLATGHVASLTDAREIIDHSFPVVRFRPVDADRWEQPYRRFRERLDSDAERRRLSAWAVE
jgi:rhamnulokinase